jgi:hypothetical protein
VARSQSTRRAGISNPAVQPSLDRREGAVARGLTVVAVIAAFLAGALLSPEGPAGAPATADKLLTLDLGDRLRVDGADIGCRVARLSRYGGRTFLDCRRAGPLAGSYATLLGEREVAVVHFVNRRAKVVFTARHEGTALTCQ